MASTEPEQAQAEEQPVNKNKRYRKDKREWCSGTVHQQLHAGLANFGSLTFFSMQRTTCFDVHPQHGIPMTLTSEYY